VATFKAAKWNWEEAKDEADDEKVEVVLGREKDHEEDPEDAFFPQDPNVESDPREDEVPEVEAVNIDKVTVKGVRNSSSSKDGRRTLTEEGENEVLEEEEEFFEAAVIDGDMPDVGEESDSRSTEDDALREALAEAGIDEDELLAEISEAIEKDNQSEDAKEKEKEENKMTPVELKKTMIFAVPLKTKNAAIVEVVIKEIVLHVERKLKYKVERIHTDPGSELQAKSLKAWCAENRIRKTMSIPEDFKGNGSAESAVGLVKR
jgi:hypothetical protein